MTDVNASLVDDIKATRAELLKRGRCTGSIYKRDTGQVCLLGAIGTATIEDFLQTAQADESDAMSLVTLGLRSGRVVKALADHLDPVLDEVASSERVWRFNDRKATDEDVFNLLDKALADLGGL